MYFYGHVLNTAFPKGRQDFEIAGFLAAHFLPPLYGFLIFVIWKTQHLTNMPTYNSQILLHHIYFLIYFSKLPIFFPRKNMEKNNSTFSPSISGAGAGAPGAPGAGAPGAPGGG